MRIFKINKRKVWHIARKDNYSYCYNASMEPKGYGDKRLTPEFVLKERDNEILCNACVGMAYKQGVIEVTDKPNKSEDV